MVAPARCRTFRCRSQNDLQRTRGAGGYFLAGGTDLAIVIQEKGLTPCYVVDLKKIIS